MSRVSMCNWVIERPLGRWQRVAREAGIGFKSRQGFSNGKVWVVHSLSITASSDMLIAKDGETLQRDENIAQQSEELINFEL